MTDFILGIKYFLDGFFLLFKKGVRLYVLLPVLINTTFFIVLFFALWVFVAHFNAWFASSVPHWLAWLSILLWVLFFLSFSLVILYTFVTFANIIAAPFNGFLSEKVEQHLTGKVSNNQTMWEMVKDAPRMIGRQLGIVLYYLPRAALMLILFFIPIVQLVASLLWFLFHAYTLSLTYLDYPSDNQRIPMKAVRQFTQQNKGLALGFGSAVLIACMVPVLNFVAIPAAVCGATKLWLERSAIRLTDR